MSDIQSDIKDHLVKSFLDIIVLSMLKDNPIHGYAIIADIHKRFDVLLSPGTLYPLLYSLEKKGMISIEQDGRRKNYIITEKGLIQSDRVINAYSAQMKDLIKFIEG
ncbi:MAG: PadR family transcriptional regulator [Candidatus Bathyarchaeota archaeon]|nr:PadR family transcriptional regulator [Candidatus Bathyarchaeota archaeon]